MCGDGTCDVGGDPLLLRSGLWSGSWQRVRCYVAMASTTTATSPSDCADSDCASDSACQVVDCSVLTTKSTCNAEEACRWNNKSKVCAPN